jgi:anti-sigma regulatory factor (Ser/Thr protein kinase)
MKIHIPNSAFLGNINPFLKGFDVSNPENLEVTADEKWMSIHPLVLSMIAALCLKVDPSNISCKNFEAPSKNYLERMGLFKFLHISSGIPIQEHEPAGRFVPLTQILDSDGLSKFITEMIPLLHLEPKQVDPIRYIVSELVRNVLEHSLSKDGAIICAQYYPKTNRISLGIADTGVGIKKTIGHSYHVETDLNAIRLALMPGVTGTTKREGGTEFNAGAGLFFTKSIASVNRGFFVIYSGGSMYKLLKRVKSSQKIVLYADPFKDRHSSEENLPSWQGTVVGVDIVLDSTNAFSSLLDHIRDTYAKAIRERKQARYKKPNFI